MNLPQLPREWKCLSLSIRKDNPAVICRTDISGEPIPRVAKLGYFYLSPTNEDRSVQVNHFYGEGWKLLSYTSLEHPRYSELKKVVDKIRQEPGADDLESLIKRPFEVIEKGAPLVIINGNEEFSLLSFGRTFDFSSTKKLGVYYIGGLIVLSYDEAMRLTDYIKKPIQDTFSNMYDIVISRYERDKERRHRNCSRNRRRRKGN